MLLSSLPQATRLLLDPTAALDAALLSEWQAACAAAGAAPGGEDDATAAARVAPVRRREPRRRVATDNFFALADALDTLAGELNTAAAFPSAAGAGARHNSGRALRTDEWDPSAADGLTDAALADTRVAQERFGASDYSGALDAVLRAAAACPAHALSPALLNNVAVCHLALEQWDPCEAATHRVLAMDDSPRYPSARRLVRICLAQMRLADAQQAIAARRDDAAWSTEVAAVKALAAYTSLYAARQYTKALESLETVLAACPCGTLEAAKARLLSLDSATEAVRYAAARAGVYPASAELHACCCELIFQAATSSADLTALLTSMNSSAAGRADVRLRLLHTNVTRCCEALARLQRLVNTRAWTEAASYAADVLAAPYLADGVKGVVHLERARALGQQASWYAALDEAHRALSYTEAPRLRADMLLLVARCEEALGRLRDAVFHTEESLRLHPNAAVTNQLHALKTRVAREQAAQDAQRTAPTPGGTKRAPPRQPPPSQPVASAAHVHYEALAVPAGSGAAEVRKAYRALAMRWHPDRWCGASAADVQAAETKFKAIQHAYEELMKVAS